MLTNERVGNLFGDDAGDQENACCSHIIRVAFESGVDSEFDYAVPDDLGSVSAGQRVRVPFGRRNKEAVGFCVLSDVSLEDSYGASGRRKLKKVRAIIDESPLLDDSMMELARWISEYYVCPLGQVLTAMVPGAVKKGAGISKTRYVWLSADDVDQAMKDIRGAKQKRLLELLYELEAIDKDSAVETTALLKAAACGSDSLKRLAEKKIVDFEQRAVMKSLPVVPDEMVFEPKQVNLNDEQQTALDSIKAAIDKQDFSVTLLYGVTDSGKTEVYIRAIKEVVNAGKGAIVLLPEIALTAQTVQRFSSRFERIAVLHSGLTAAQRNVQWQRIRTSQADVVIGARSAIFAPMKNLGLVVVDEEHEPSYKQDTVPRYNGRDVAIKRAQLCKAHCLLGSATPSLESLTNTRTKKHFRMVRLKKRVMDLPLPVIELVNLCQSDDVARGGKLISAQLREALNKALEKNEQAILLLNRRGYSNFVYCASCRHTLRCRNCDVSLTFHKRSRYADTGMKTITGDHMRSGQAVCHYCGSKTLVPRKCPLCGKGLAMIGLGSQRLQEELVHDFPQAKIARIDSDSMAGGGYFRLLGDFSKGKIDILAGTQMLAKGLHFPNVTVVGIISADTCLYIPDFRANERTFQLISQVAGRTGRSKKKGVVYVQTFMADQPVIKYAINNDFEGFVAEELKHRKACDLPPFWRLAIILLRDTNFDRLELAAQDLKQRVETIIAKQQMQVHLRGPMPATISRLQRYHRMQMMIQAPTPAQIGILFDNLRKMGPPKPAVNFYVDIDPVNLL